MTNFRKMIAGAAAALMLSAGGAFATVLTFDSASNGASYMEGGATISSISGDNVNTFGGVLGFPCCSGGAFTWEMTTGGLFDLLSIDVNHTDFEDPITFTGLNGGSTIATQVFNNNAGAFNFTGFEGLDALRISMSGPVTYGDPQFDNLSFEATSAVPLPAALPLLLVAIGGLGIARRRKS